eukprot:745059_1
MLLHLLNNKPSRPFHLPTLVQQTCIDPIHRNIHNIHHHHSHISTITTTSLPSVICSFPTHSQSMLDLWHCENKAPNCRTRTFIPSKMDAKQEKKEADRTNNNVSTHVDLHMRMSH